MKKAIPVIIIIAIITCLVCLFTCGRGGNALENAIRQALVRHDTTAVKFDSICGIIKAAPEEYAQYLTPEGEINYGALNDLVTEVGSKLRPPMAWNIMAYGTQSYSLTVYFERSGSMVPYDHTGGRGQLKKAVNDLINYFPEGDKVKINIVNDDIYPYNGTVDSFLQDRNIYASTEGVGNAAYTDFQKIFNKVLEAQTPGNVSVVVTDLIYSPADTRDVSIDKILNEENSLATSIFKRYKGKSIIVHQLMGDYNGKYYPYNNNAVDYNGMRPFYLIIIADTRVMDAMARSNDYKQFLAVEGSRNSYRFNQGESRIEWKVIPGWKDNAGRFRLNHNGPGNLTDVESDPTTGVLRLAVAANLAPLNQSDDVLCNASRYTVESLSGFKVSVQPVKPDMITGNNKAYLDGMTHIITLTGDYKGPKDNVKVSLRNEFPQWIEQSTCSDDTNTSSPSFSTTTLGLSSFLKGINQAFGTGNNYFTIELSME